MRRSIIAISITNNKNMPNKNSSRSKYMTRLRSTPVLILSSLILVSATLSHGFGVFAATCNSSSDCQQQINSLDAANNNAQNSLSALGAQAGSYQDTINQLVAQISSVQAQIDANQAQQAKLQQQIIDAQNQIAQQKVVLGNDVKTMYVTGQMTPVEMLATSGNLSDYIDKQQAYSVVQDKIQDTLKQIAALQVQLTSQKAQVDALLKAQQAQQAQLAESQAQQQSLLNYNQDQQDQFNAQIAANKTTINDLRKQQTAINIRTAGSGVSDPSGLGYPWSNAVFVDSNYDWALNGSLYDPLGWNYRNCTSYAFWRLDATRGIALPWSDFPTVYNSGGRIGMSISDFRNLGYTVDHDPSGASLAVWGVGPNDPNGSYGGYYGHIMYVESSDSSSAFVSDYNLFGDGRGHTHTIYPTSYTWFVHIP